MFGFPTFRIIIIRQWVEEKEEECPWHWDNSVCSEARAIWEDISEAGEDEFIEIGLEIQ